MSAMTIRAYRESDFDAVVDLWRATELTAPHNDPARDIAFCRATTDAELFVGEADGRLVATVMTGHDGHRGWLYYLAVEPHRQGRGMGRQLTAHAEAWLTARGVGKVNLMIRDTNTRVRDLYAAIGYAEEPRLVMAKFLPPPVPQPEPGKLETEITHLEMHARPGTAPVLPDGADVRIEHVQAPSLEFYRYLYGSVGAEWLWWERRVMADDKLAAIIHDPGVEVFVMYAGGEPAGYGELDRRDPGNVELAYFGLMPHFIGRGLGLYFLDWLVDRAWNTDQIKRFWVHTCTLDHPRALGTYQRAGFEIFDRETEVVDDPRLSGVFG